VVSGPETSGVIGDVIHDVVLAPGEGVKVFGANAYVQEGPLTTASLRHAGGQLQDDSDPPDHPAPPADSPGRSGRRSRTGLRHSAG